MSCTIMECPSLSLPMNNMLAESCSSTYQSVCGLQCEQAYIVILALYASDQIFDYKHIELVFDVEEYSLQCLPAGVHRRN